jgi:hypothetical protein
VVQLKSLKKHLGQPVHIVKVISLQIRWKSKGLAMKVNETINVCDSDFVVAGFLDVGC